MKSWSNYQLNVFNEVESGVKSLVVSAVAGSGKTTTIVECANRQAAQGKEQLFLAFNKSIASELSSRFVGTNVVCKTLHAYGFGAIMRAYGRGTKLDDKKWVDYVTNNINTLSSTQFANDIEKGAYIHNVCNLLNKCRINLIRRGDLSGIDSVAIHHNIEYIDDENMVVNDLLGIAYNMPNDGVIDYTDMITLPITDSMIKSSLGKYDIVYIDECQDLSKAQQELMLLAVRRGGKFVAVGDAQQAINGFAGADSNSFNRLVNLAGGNTLPLSVCYCCGKTIVDAVKDIVPNISAYDGAIDGEIKHTTKLQEIVAGDMVLCRKSAPLVGCALKFIANGISAQVKGRDIAEGLKNLILKQRCRSVNGLIDKLDSQVEKERAKAIKKGLSPDCGAVMTMQDKVDCIKVIAEKCVTIQDILDKLDMLFRDKESGNVVQFSTIHKAKGLESERVFLLLPNKLPLVWDMQQDWEYEQEMNLKYVCITRAKKVFTYVDLDEECLREYDFGK